MDNQGLFKYQAKHIFIETCLGSYCIPGIIQTLAIKQNTSLASYVSSLCPSYLFSKPELIMLHSA